MAGGGGGRDLPETPTWAVAVVCAVIVLISVAMEQGLHRLDHWFHARQKKAMREALEKIKAELMLMGFISLLLAVLQTPITKICIPEKAGSIMLPCKLQKDDDGKATGDGRRRLLSWYLEQQAYGHRRFLAAAAGGDDYCVKKDGKEKDAVPVIRLNVVRLLADLCVCLKKWEVVDMILPLFIEHLEEGDASSPSSLRLRLLDAISRVACLGFEKSYRESIVLMTRSYLDRVKAVGASENNTLPSEATTERTEVCDGLLRIFVNLA